MSLKDIQPGKHIPDDFNVIIEIPAQAGMIKYEMDKDSGLLSVDRFMPTAMYYPANYGFVPNTLWRWRSSRCSGYYSYASASGSADQSTRSRSVEHGRRVWDRPKNIGFAHQKSLSPIGPH